MKSSVGNIAEEINFNFNYIDAFIIWLITLCSLRLYTFLISVTISKALAVGGVCIVMAFLMVQLVYGSYAGVKKRFRFEVIIIFISLFISVLGAYFFHEQSIGVTIFAQYEYYFFFFYILIHRLKPDPDKIIEMCVWLGYGYTVIYFLQYLVYPIEITSSKVIYDRGTVRSLIPGSEFMITTWFIQLSRYFITKKIKYILSLMPIVLIIILLATRQVMAGMMLLTLLAIILSRNLKSKAAVVVLIALAIIPFYFSFQGVFDQIVGITARQSRGFQQDIRTLAAQYFLFDLNHNPLWILTGNGMPGTTTSYGMYLYRISEELGYHQSDVGIIGTFSRFGIFFVLAEIIILIRLSIQRTREKFSFIRYNALLMLLTMFTGAGLRASTVIILILMMYVAEVEKHSSLLNSQNIRSVKEGI